MSKQVEMKSYWKFWCNAKSEASARILLTRFIDKLHREVSVDAIESYHKGGFVISFYLSHDLGIWNDFVVDVIELGQQVGYDWRLSGDVRSDLSGWCNGSGIAGIQSIEWTCDRKSYETRAL
ncbi:hypothetical protein ACFL2Q_02545 [Thermodesulfobacteriota bacterium]